MQKRCTTIYNGYKIEEKEDNGLVLPPLSIEIVRKFQLNLLFLEHNPFVSFQVGHVNFFSVFDNFWMFLWHQPADVAEEESTVSIVRICICVRIFMVLSVITNPYIKAIL